MNTNANLQTGTSRRPFATGAVAACYIVPGLPHVLLASEKSKGWTSLNQSFAKVKAEIEAIDPDVILYFSSQWLSVLGYLFQADPNPEWTLVDHNWHELGSMSYAFKVDTELAQLYGDEVSKMDHYTRQVNYKGFPIDTGTVVAQKLLNPHNKFKAAMVSCNMYAEKQESLSIGQAAMRALEKSSKRAVVVLVSGLSSRFEVKDVDPAKDQISSAKDDEWNRKILDLLSEGRLEDVSEVGREFAKQANADMGFRGVWWLNGLAGKSNEFTGHVFDYQPVWGTGAAIVGLYPNQPLRSKPDWRNDEADLVERFAVNSSGIPAASADSHATTSVGTSSVVGQHSYRQSVTSNESIQTFQAPANTADRVSSSRAPAPVGAYPHARKVGDLIFLSGVGPRQAGSKEIPGTTFDSKGELIAHDVEIQTRAVVENIRAILEDMGAGLDNIIDVQVFLTDMKNDFQRFNKVYSQYFTKSGPTRTTIEVNSLPTPIAVEFKVIAKV